MREFQRRAVRYRHILDVEAGFRSMARRYRHERATGAQRAFSQGGPALATSATTTTAQGPQAAPSAPPPPTTAPAPDTSATQTTPAAVTDMIEFRTLQLDRQRMLRRMDTLQQEVARNSRRLRGIKKILRRANL
ncbi:hypothetical protein NDU88_005871 [Pleurodeles waltl]|uniref:Uncharacterized protein n=1 Tax=Pleurodeles waltl TaxID=8319 RepID=A0AAV7TWK9_PLEWA|nr:hypothetical protein NDU88_005871 [Pleurodeles waltl]